MFHFFLHQNLCVFVVSWHYSHLDSETRKTVIHTRIRATGIWIFYTMKKYSIQISYAQQLIKIFWAIFILKKSSGKWKECQTFGRLVLAVWSGADWLVFSKVLQYKNDSKMFHELLSSILTFTECITSLKKIQTADMKTLLRQKGKHWIQHL